MTNRAALRPDSLPTDLDGWRSFLHERCAGSLGEVRRLVDHLKQTPPGDPLDIIRAWNDVNLALQRAFSSAGVLSQVHPDEDIRTLAEAAEQEAQKVSTDLSLDLELFDLLSSVDVSRLDPGAARVLDHTLRDFRRAGVDQDESTRQRLRGLAEKETALGQELSKNIRDSVLSVALDPDQLRGLPADYVAEHPAGDDGSVTVTTDYPDVQPFLAFAQDAGARRKVMLAFNNRAWPDNDAILTELLSLRAEHAGLLGYDGWPSFDAEVKMIGAGSAIARFIDETTASADESGRRDVATLLERMRIDDPHVGVIDRADATYYAEVVRREQYDVDSQLVRTYFDFDKVRSGLLDVTGRLFGLQYVRAPEATSWHEDVAGYDVHLDGEMLGRIYLDLHPRAGKYKHAAQFTL
ncbi:MAG: peptidase M3, partial [Propionibacteriales bacterium]|nr:peptidase M3 [Propionibacteriales bacterium]